MSHESASGARRSIPRAYAALALAFLVSLPAVTTRLYASDEIEYFAYLRSLWFDRDLSFENEYRYFHDRGIAQDHLFAETFLERRTQTGRHLNFATIGCALFWAPFYGAADLIARAARAAGLDVEVDGFSGLYIGAVTYGSAVYGFLAVFLSLALVRRVLGRASSTAGAIASAVAVWVGTPLVFYMYVAPGMSHAVSAFVVALFLAAWLEVRATWSRGGLAVLGGLAALMGMVREQDLFFAVGPAADFIWHVVRHRGLGLRPAIARAAVGALTFAACYLPQAATYLVLNGRLGPPAEVARKMSWNAPFAWPVLWSSEHGFFVWTPLAALGLAGLVWLATPASAARFPGARRFGVIALVMVAIQIYLSGSVESWTVAGAFGQRRFVALTALLTVGLAVLIHLPRQPWSRRAMGAVVALTVWWNLGLAFQFGAGLMDRQRLEPRQNAYATFVTVPLRLPELTYRYLFDRPSFYRSRGQ